jgi:hypothetical protein
MRPNLANVLAAVLPGRVIRVDLSPEQRRALRDPDARLALDVVRHLLGARAASVQPRRPPHAFPLTEATFQAVARKLGRPVGIKRSRALIRRLVAEGVLEPSGSYRQRYTTQGSTGYRVGLYRLAVGVASALMQRAVGSRRRVKRRQQLRWWQHPLFGDLFGLPPPHLGPQRAARMRSMDELKWAPR